MVKSMYGKNKSVISTPKPVQLDLFPATKDASYLILEALLSILESGRPQVAVELLRVALKEAAK